MHILSANSIYTYIDLLREKKTCIDRNRKLAMGSSMKSILFLYLYLLCGMHAMLVLMCDLSVVRG